MRQDESSHSVSHEAPSQRFLDIERMSRKQLETALVRGVTPDVDALVGWEFRGLNTPGWARLAGIKKFVKGFYRPSGNAGEVYGYNCPTVQNRLDHPWCTRPDDRAPRRFGFYRVYRVDPSARDNAYLHALLLDYSQGQNSRHDPTSGLRDYLVQVDPEDRDIYLGKAYYALGGVRVATSFFALERLRPGASDPHF
jgi:hypothetical protein